MRLNLKSAVSFRLSSFLPAHLPRVLTLFIAALWYLCVSVKAVRITHSYSYWWMHTHLHSNYKHYSQFTLTECTSFCGYEIVFIDFRSKNEMKWNGMEEEKSHHHAHKLVSFLPISLSLFGLCYVFLFWTFRFRTLALSQSRSLCVVRLTSSEKWTAKATREKEKFRIATHVASMVASNNESSSSNTKKKNLPRKKKIQSFIIDLEWHSNEFEAFELVFRIIVARWDFSVVVGSFLFSFSLFFNWIFLVDWFEIVWAYAA